MISRYHLLCPGCGQKFIARIGVEPTSGTRFYLLCPECNLPVRGSITGREFEDHRVTFECDVLNSSHPELPDSQTVTVNPFVPSLYEADSYSPVGAFPTMTLLHVLGEQGFLDFGRERHAGLETIENLWPNTRMLFQYFLQDNQTMFSRLASEHFNVSWDPKTSHQRTTVAYQALGFATNAIVGSTKSESSTVFRRFSSKHSAALKVKEHRVAVRARGELAAHLERSVFTEIDRFVAHHDSWEMGRLIRFLAPESNARLENLVLYRDEFSIVRDLYQQGFELACRCLWPLVAAQNTVKRGDPNDFGGDHPNPAKVPVGRRPGNLNQFEKMPNAFKIAYTAQVPGWGAFASLLDHRQRNTIGHATAHHDLQAGRIISDKDSDGLTYLEFLGLTFGVFEALAILAQVLRAARVAASPDFFGEAP